LSPPGIAELETGSFAVAVGIGAAVHATIRSGSTLVDETAANKGGASTSGGGLIELKGGDDTTAGVSTVGTAVSDSISFATSGSKLGGRVSVVFPLTGPPDLTRYASSACKASTLLESSFNRLSALVRREKIHNAKARGKAIKTRKISPIRLSFLVSRGRLGGI
jgi:hypothetical protein